MLSFLAGVDVSACTQDANEQAAAKSSANFLMDFFLQAFPFECIRRHFFA
jgi:hypothetical protein